MNFVIFTSDGDCMINKLSLHTVKLSLLPYECASDPAFLFALHPKALLSRFLFWPKYDILEVLSRPFPWVRRSGLLDTPFCLNHFHESGEAVF